MILLINTCFIFELFSILALPSLHCWGIRRKNTGDEVEPWSHFSVLYPHDSFISSSEAGYLGSSSSQLSLLILEIFTVSALCLVHEESGDTKTSALKEGLKSSSVIVPR